WKAFIDGKETPIVKTNYALRGLAIPAGKHSIQFRFEPQGYMTGTKLTTVFSIILGIIVLIAVYTTWKSTRKPG
ncbi:MAG: hypothetical protein EOO05_09335, partial [Chitinophagaceae bacterium]